MSTQRAARGASGFSFLLSEKIHQAEGAALTEPRLAPPPCRKAYGPRGLIFLC